MMQDLDAKYGRLRMPERVDDWERERVPASLSGLAIAASSLLQIRSLADTAIMGAALRAQNFLWVMTADGSIMIAVEELALTYPASPYTGYPRRRGYRHPHEEKKLGHPTLIAAGPARIAGELGLDLGEHGLCWILNANSGRYCRQEPPETSQIDAVGALFTGFGLNVKVDYD